MKAPILAAALLAALPALAQDLRGRLLIHDALYTESRAMQTKPREGCPVCGGRGLHSA